MSLAPGLLIRTLVRPGGRLTTVVVRRRRAPAPQRQAGSAERHVLPLPAEGKPERNAPVPAAPSGAGFTRPVVRALATLGARARPVGRDGVALDGRLVPLMRMVAEANRLLAARGSPPIRYPGLRAEGGR